MTAGAAPDDLLERDVELSALARLLDKSVARSGGAVLIEGEAGVGKTALLERACDQAVKRGMAVLAGRRVRAQTWSAPGCPLGLRRSSVWPVIK